MASHFSANVSLGYRKATPLSRTAGCKASVATPGLSWIGAEPWPWPPTLQPHQHSSVLFGTVEGRPALILTAFLGWQSSNRLLLAPCRIPGPVLNILLPLPTIALWKVLEVSKKTAVGGYTGSFLLDVGVCAHLSSTKNTVLLEKEDQSKR